VHSCPDCGFDHEVSVPDPAPVIVESGPNENDVAIAEIQAAQSIETAKIYASEADPELREEVARLRGELSGIRDTLETLAGPPPAPDPVPVVVDPAPPADPGPVVPLPPAEPVVPKAKKAPGFWDAYQ
jgi:hypothetical protein